MDVDKLGEAYNKGVIAGQEHSNPSPETLRFMERQEKTNETLTAGITQIQLHLVKQDEKLEAIHQQTLKTNGRVSCLEEYRTNNEAFITELKEDKQEFKKHWKTTVWDLFKVGVISLISVVIGIMGYKEIFEKLIN